MPSCWKRLDWTRFIDETDIEMANATTCHGMTRMCLVGGVVRRTVWVLICSLVFAVCIWQLSIRIQTFIQYQLKTDVSVQYTNKLDFPSVTICNLNAFSSEAVTDFDKMLFQNISNELTREIRSIDFDHTPPDDLRNILVELLTKYDEREKLLLQNFGMDTFKTDKWIHDKSWRLSDDNLVCLFGDDPCSADNFEPVYTIEGKCYTFKGFQNQSLMQTIPGSDGGLSIYINIKQDDYSPLSLRGDYQSEAGIKIIVHPAFEPPDPNIGVSAMPGFSAFIPVKLTTMDILNKKPWSECASGSTGMAPPYDTYSVKTCQTLCEADAHMDHCGCRPWYIQGFVDYPVCSIARTTFCQMWVIDEKHRTDCIAQCLPACKTYDYRFQATYAQLPSTASIDKLMINLFGTDSNRSNITMDELRKNWLQISVYFDDFTYVSTSSSEAYPLGSFLADAGGQFNLFCGFSVLTFFEWLEYFIFKIYRHSRDWYKNRRSRKMERYGEVEEPEVQHKYESRISSAIINAGKTLTLKRLANIDSMVHTKRRQSINSVHSLAPLAQRAISVSEAVVTSEPKPLFSSSSKRIGRTLSRRITVNSLQERRNSTVRRLSTVLEGTSSYNPELGSTDLVSETINE